jgi:hypothetical protein
LPTGQLRPVMLEDGQQLLVVDVPEEASGLVLAEEP